MSSRRRLALVALFVFVSARGWATTRGPDAGNYTATDSTVYSFVDVSGPGGGASVLSGIDDGTAALTLPFTFHFYGQPYGMVCVSANGAIYFIASAAACDGFNDFANTDLTSTAPPIDGPGLFPFWTDLTFQHPGAGAVVYHTLGVAGGRRFILQWQNAYPQGSPNPVSFQVILSEGSNRILFQYRTVALGEGNPASNGGQATIGIRNAAALTNNQQLAWSFGAPVIGDSTALLFSGDSVGPVITAPATPSTLWPPNGRMVPVTVTGTMTDAGSGLDAASARFAVIDELGEVQPSGGITVDANGTYSFTVSLLASKQKKNKQEKEKESRTYTIEVTAKDVAGNTGKASAIVTVPHDNR